MTEVMFPTSIIPTVSDLHLQSIAGISVSPFSNARQTVSRVGTAWGGTIQVKNVAGGDRRELMAFLSELDGMANRFYLRDHTQVGISGSFPSTEISPNSSFDTSVSPWTASSSAISVNGRRLKVRNTTAGAGSARSGALTIANGATYVYRVMCYPGNVNNWLIRAGTTAGASNYVGSTETTPGLKTFQFQSSGTVVHLAVYCQTSTSGDFVFFDNVTVTRCGQVNGASQTGNILVIDNMSGTGDGVLLRGELVEFGGEVKRLTQDFDDQASNRRLFFEPAIRTSPSTNTPVITLNPMMKCIADTNSLSWSNRRGVFSDFSLPFIEDIS